MNRAQLSLVLFASNLLACGGDLPSRPLDMSPMVDEGNVNTPEVKYPDLRTFWSRSVARTCGPNNGVCHDNRQFPDLQTASGLLDSINRRCNQIRDDPKTIDNLCEPKGDVLSIGTFTTQIGRVTAAPSVAIPSSLTITLKDAIPAGATGAVAVVRDTDGLPKVTITIPMNAVTSQHAGDKQIILDYSKLSGVAPGGTLGRFLMPSVYTPGGLRQVEMGDPNGDGVFGADLGGALVRPGKPMLSYLFLRVLSPIAVGPGQQLTNVMAPATQEAQMPIANFQYWDADQDLVALWCWISTMKEDGSNADGPIDYANCDQSSMPMRTAQPGEATTFTAVFENVLRPSCSSCHYAGTDQGTALFFDTLQQSYDTLVGVRGTGPIENKLMLPYVTRSDPAKSYLYLKVSGDSKITGTAMPPDGKITPAAIKSIGQWIADGANNN